MQGVSGMVKKTLRPEPELTASGALGSDIETDAEARRLGSLVNRRSAESWSQMAAIREPFALIVCSRTRLPATGSSRQSLELGPSGQEVNRPERDKPNLRGCQNLRLFPSATTKYSPLGAASILVCSFASFTKPS